MPTKLIEVEFRLFGTRSVRIVRVCCTFAVVAACVAFIAGAALASQRPFIARLKTVTPVAGTVPSNGDQGPHGLATVPESIGRLVRGDVLISNFNNAGKPPSGDLHGTGSTLLEISPRHKSTLFARVEASELHGLCPGGVGLTGALAALPYGYVVVGSLPTTDGTLATAQAGCLIVLNSSGKLVESLAQGTVDGPWGMTAVKAAHVKLSGPGIDMKLFAANVLNVGPGAHAGTIVRIGLHIGGHKKPFTTAVTVIARGFPVRPDPAGLVLGPTGLALGAHGTLYVADAAGNRIAAIPHAAERQTPVLGGGRTVTAGGFLEHPLGIAIAPNGDILTANAGDGKLVETAPSGAQLLSRGTGAGADGLFGLSLPVQGCSVYLTNARNNTVELLH